MLIEGTTTGRVRTRTRAQARALDPLTRAASPKPHSIWIGAVCARCNLPISATARTRGTTVTGQFAWFHVATGNEACAP